MDLQALSTQLAGIGGKSDGVRLREDIRKLRTQLKRSISEEQVRQCRLLEQHNDIRYIYMYILFVALYSDVH